MANGNKTADDFGNSALGNGNYYYWRGLRQKILRVAIRVDESLYFVAARLSYFFETVCELPEYAKMLVGKIDLWKIEGAIVEHCFGNPGTNGWF